MHANVDSIVQVFVVLSKDNYDGEWLLGRYLSTLSRPEGWSDQEFKRFRKKAYGFFSKMVTYGSIQNREEELHKELCAEKSCSKALLKSFMRAYGGQDTEEFGLPSTRLKNDTGGKEYIKMCFNLWRAVSLARCTQTFHIETD